MSTNVIDPIHSLAFSIQSKAGVYAVLIGSGVSRAAGILTGWEVTLDLIRKLARFDGGETDLDPETWYTTKFEREPDYSDLLDGLAKTPAERQQLLQQYFEPTEAEREEGQKEPTAAHHAIAALAARGFIKVIITTNFDRLMENALSAAGVEATVLSTSDQVRGAVPLVHTRCCLLKVHGDYRDPRIRNTTEELAEYCAPVERMLHQIFDEFGLIVCGWSGDWDEALRRALEGVPSRRFTTYWTTRQRPSAKAQQLIRHRQAEVIEIGDADTFFSQVNEHVASIEEFAARHPLSAELAITSLKRYLAEPRFKIQLSDLIDAAVQEVVEATSHESFSVAAPQPDVESVTKRLRAYNAACSKLTAMAVVGGTWADKEHYSVWQRALERLSRTSTVVGRHYSDWRDLQRYPATLLFYALGLGAVEAKRLEFVNSLLTLKIQREQEDDIAAVGILPPSFLLQMGERNLEGLEGVEERVTVLNQWIHNSLRGQTRRVFHDDADFTQAFDKLEILLALGGLGVPSGMGMYWSPVGCFFWRGETRDRFLAEIRQSVDTEQNRSPFLLSGIVGADPEDCLRRIETLEERVEEVGWDWPFKLKRMHGRTAQT